VLLEVLKVLKGLLEVGGAAEGSGGAAGGLLTICARLCSYLPCITLHKRKTETRHL
jgi:hypothetical protein